MELATLVMQSLGHDTNLEADDQIQWVTDYSPTVRFSINDMRSYVGQRMRSAVLKVWNDGGRKAPNAFPPIAGVKRCVMREIDLEKKEDKDLFQWHWNCLLPMASKGPGWGEVARKYNTISMVKDAVSECVVGCRAVLGRRSPIFSTRILTFVG